MPFDSTTEKPVLPQADADLIADFRAWVERQPEDATWDFYEPGACVMAMFWLSRYRSVQAIHEYGYEAKRRGPLWGLFSGYDYVKLPDAACRAVNEACVFYGTITRAALLRELAKLEG